MVHRPACLAGEAAPESRDSPARPGACASMALLPGCCSGKLLDCCAPAGASFSPEVKLVLPCSPAGPEAAPVAPVAALERPEAACWPPVTGTSPAASGTLASGWRMACGRSDALMLPERPEKPQTHLRPLPAAS